VGAQGTTLETPNSFSSVYPCKTSLAVAPDGTATVGCNYFYGSVGYFNADGSRTREPGGLGVTTLGADTDSIWDGTTFDTTAVSDGGIVRMFRDGSTAPWLELVPYTSGVSRSSIDTVWLGNSLALGSVNAGVYELRRYTMPADLNATTAATFHNTVNIVSTPNVVSKPDLLQTGAGKLLAVWPDNRWGAASELYAAPIDLKACP
jgi:hypothetical protein